MEFSFRQRALASHVTSGQLASKAAAGLARTTSAEMRGASTAAINKHSVCREMSVVLVDVRVHNRPEGLGSAATVLVGTNGIPFEDLKGAR